MFIDRPFNWRIYLTFEHAIRFKSETRHKVETLTNVMHIAYGRVQKKKAQTRPYFLPPCFFFCVCVFITPLECGGSYSS